MNGSAKPWLAVWQPPRGGASGEELVIRRQQRISPGTPEGSQDPEGNPVPHPQDDLAQSASHLVRTAEKVVTKIGNRDLAAARELTAQARDALQRLERALTLELQTH